MKNYTEGKLPAPASKGNEKPSPCGSQVNYSPLALRFVPECSLGMEGKEGRRDGLEPQEQALSWKVDVTTHWSHWDYWRLLIPTSLAYKTRQNNLWHTLGPEALVLPGGSVLISMAHRTTRWPIHHHLKLIPINKIHCPHSHSQTANRTGQVPGRKLTGDKMATPFLSWMLSLLPIFLVL